MQGDLLAVGAPGRDGGVVVVLATPYPGAVNQTCDVFREVTIGLSLSGFLDARAVALSGDRFVVKQPFGLVQEWLFDGAIWAPAPGFVLSGTDDSFGEAVALDRRPAARPAPAVHAA